MNQCRFSAGFVVNFTLSSTLIATCRIQLFETSNFTAFLPHRIGPFAAGSHMVQNPKYLRAKECARLQNKSQLTRKVGFFFVYTFPSGVLSHSLALQYSGYLQLQRAYLIKS